MQYKAVIVGCGRIGVSFDSNDAEEVLTHAKALSMHPRVSLIAVMDIDKHIAKVAGDKWKCQSYTDFQKMIREEKPDIVSICVPDKFHYDYLIQCLYLKPRVVIAEKPLTLHVKESQEIVRRYQDAAIPLFVNYTRRYDLVIQSLKRRIEDGDFGRILNACIKFTKGLLHNGSHAVDTSNFLFGKFLFGQPLNAIIDYSGNDPTLSAILKYEKCPALFLIGCDVRFYSIFEIDIMAEKGRILFEQSGRVCREYDVRKSSIFKGYSNLGLVKEYNTNLDKCILNLVDNVVQHLDNGQKVICSGNDALMAQEICSELIESWKRQNPFAV